MFTLPGYATGELLYQSKLTQIVRAVRVEDGLPVVLKRQDGDRASPEDRARFRQEFDLIRRLRLGGVAAAYELIAHDGTLTMVLEDIGGVSLDRADLGTSLPLREWLVLAIRITQCLGQLHGQQVMHKGINPSHVIWNRRDGEVRLIDLGVSAELPREFSGLSGNAWLEDSLGYLAPEQTGRMNRSVDYRADLYSLGITFFELLTGRLPFAADDALGMVYAHIARQAPTVDEIDPSLPPMLGAIVAKLLGKTAEERYQCASGLEADLSTCLEALDADGKISVFPIGSRDFPSRLQIPQKLYGRDSQLAALLDAFGRVSQGQGELLLVAGYSGIGKSALVHEVQKPITRCRGYFIEGKFDQFKRDLPYTSFIQAFSRLIRQLLTENEFVVNEWRARLLRVLGNNGQVIIDVIPDLELLIGSQPPVVSLPPAQAQNRFNHEFRKFAGQFASAEHPLVIFLDDLQWADMPSLQLMALLMEPPATSHLLLIGAYRDNEITPAHPMPAILGAMRQRGATMTELILPALGLADVQQLLGDALLTRPEKVSELAELCLAKTSGNPFFLNQFLATLVASGMLRMNASTGIWHWDIRAIHLAGITDNVVELMVAKLQQLPQATQQVMQGAACLGNVFDLRMLAAVCELSEPETARRLWPALREELAVPLDDRYLFSRQAALFGETDLVPVYRFLHDRVHQAAYLLSGHTEKAVMHLAIGRIWLKTLSEAERQPLLFDLVNHLNIGCALMEGGQERIDLAHLNLEAARKAKAAAAYKPALGYVQSALALLSERDWIDHYDLMIALHWEAAETSFLAIDYEQMQHYIDAALRHAANSLDAVRMHEIRIQAYAGQGKTEEAILLGLQVLKLLGMDFPERPTAWDVSLSLVCTKLALAGKTDEELLAMPDAEDPRVLAANRLLLKLSPPAYYVRHRHFLLFLFKAIRLSLRYGYGPATAADFAVYSMVLNGREDTAGSLRFGDLARKLQLQNRPAMEINRCRTLAVVHSRAHHWRLPLREGLEPLARDYLCGMEIGDLDFGAIAAKNHCLHSFYAGCELDVLEQETTRYSDAVSGLQRPMHHMLLSILHQALHNLMGRAAHPTVLEGDILDTQQLAMLQTMEFDQVLMFHLHSMRAELCLHFGDYRGTIENTARAYRCFDSAMGAFARSLVVFHEALALTALIPEMPALARLFALRKVRKNHARLERWARHAPSNFRHKCLLIEAEIARVTGDGIGAGKAYDQAIHLAARHRFLNEEALARELAGRFHLEAGQETVARFYLTGALESYRRWGAQAKVAELEGRYPEWLGGSRDVGTPVPAERETFAFAGSGPVTMDLATIMKSAQALSQEIMLERLLTRLMDITMENAGAQRGILLLQDEQAWFIEAERPQTNEAIIRRQVDFEDAGHELLSASLAHYVLRTRDVIVIHDARNEPLLARDRYVQRLQPRSILVIPILHQGELIGMLYLENNAASGAFTERRSGMLQLLASQAAISIVNARLYAGLEERVNERTTEVVNAMQALQETQQQLILQAKMASVGALTAGVAHEINNPANFAHAGVQTLQKDLNQFRQFLIALAGEDAGIAVLEALNQRIDALLTRTDIIIEGTSRIRDLVRDLRSYSRLGEAETKAVPIADSLMSTIHLVRMQYAESVEIVCELDANPVLECRPAQLNQVFMNLIVNACHAIAAKQQQSGNRSRGLLRIRSRIADTQWLTIEFEDTGCGMPPAVLDRIFEPFFTTKDGGTGTGLGLSISFGIIERHQGKIQVRSVPGEGTCFTIQLPMLPAEPESWDRVCEA